MSHPNLDLSKDIDKMTHQYLVTALWASVDEYSNPMDASFSVENFSPIAILQAQRDCGVMLMAADGMYNLMDLDTSVIELEVSEKIRDYMEDQASNLGHDFWLTRCGHGTGFFDRDLGDLGGWLTEVAVKFGNVDVYEGADGLLYLE